MATALPGVSWASAAPPKSLPLPTEFAGEVITIALAFSLPALLAGAYLLLQSLQARLGTRTLIASCLAIALFGAVAIVLPDVGAGALQWAGLTTSAK